MTHPLQWLQHNGGECPVEPDTMVYVRWRNLEEFSSRSANLWGWKHYGEDDDIIAYALASPTPAQYTEIDDLVAEYEKLPERAAALDAARQRLKEAAQEGGTPRTDALFKSMSIGTMSLADPLAAMLLHARQLERELAQAMKLVEDTAQQYKSRQDFIIEQHRRELAAAKAEAENLRSVMVAAAEEIHEHWQAHCDAEGYGPANLMRRLEEGIAVEYAYKAGDFARLKAEADRLRKDAKRLDWLEESKESHAFCHIGYGDYRYYAHQKKDCQSVRQVIDAARSGKEGE